MVYITKYTIAFKFKNISSLLKMTILVLRPFARKGQTCKHCDSPSPPPPLPLPCLSRHVYIVPPPLRACLRMKLKLLNLVFICAVVGQIKCVAFTFIDL